MNLVLTVFVLGLNLLDSANCLLLLNATRVSREVVPLDHDYGTKRITCNKYLGFLARVVDREWEGISGMEHYVISNATDGSGTCHFGLDLNVLFNYFVTRKFDPTTMDWYCWLSPKSTCDGFSECLTDECGCGEDVFKCADGNGCIARANLCDGYKDCLDGSDECMCDDIVMCVLDDAEYCVPREKFCRGRILMYQDCIPIQEVNCTGTKIDHNYLGEVELQEKPLMKCLDSFYITIGRTHSLFEQWCKDNCDKQVNHFCERIMIPNLGSPVFRCENETYSRRIPFNMICDGKIDCKNGFDEESCPGQYNCKNTTQTGTFVDFIDSSLVCNGYKDCTGGDDECQTCLGTGTSSDTKMVQSSFLQALIVIQCGLIFILNLVAIWDICHRESNSPATQVDKLTLGSICFYDSLMGIYLAYIFINSLLFSGKYCLNDHEWRSGLQCDVLGFLFTFSAHGSLFMISLTSLTRCCKCVLGYQISFKATVYISSVLHTVNAIHSVIPILPVSFIQDVFRARMTFHDNPFMREYNTFELTRKFVVYFGGNITVPDTYSMLDRLNNVSTGGHMFEPQELGYYSYSSLCIQNIFSDQQSLLGYKIIYFISITALLVIVSISYISIVIHSYRTSRDVNQLANNPNQNNNNDLSMKVMLMIGSQLLSWITVMTLTIVYSYIDAFAPQLLYELIAVLIFPVNSFLNPVFNSFLYKWICTQVKWLINLVANAVPTGVNSVGVADEIELEVRPRE